MNIDRIETFLLKAPLGKQRFYSSQTAFPERKSLLVKITTDEGVEGWGECGHYGPGDQTAAFIHDALAPRLLGRDALATEPIWNDLYCYSRDFGRKSTPIEAISGVDVALWDIRGKEAGKPCHALMGGAFRDHVRSYATGLYYRGEDVEDLASALDQVRDEAQAYVEMGFTAVKGKVGLLSVEDDIKRMEAVRSVVGDGFLLMTDANHAYTRHSALRMGEALEALGFYWFEEPVIPEDIDGHAWLRRKLSIAIATGECEYTRYGFLEILQKQAADILQPDLGAAGGLSEGLRIYTLATAYHTPICLHAWGSGVALAAALQFCAIQAPLPHTAFPRAPENEPMLEYDR
ncbi:MAG: mandelate racemase/muconate lactonizing enzyme family protein, partial [Candidatus Sumerlaeota bacterium]|nr:mandelate racemase/muconate lactonizing enzyme family protein [Candidatus Sumerlaeota bacterium]